MAQPEFKKSALRLSFRVDSMHLAAEEEHRPFMVWHGTWTPMRWSTHQWDLPLVSPPDAWLPLPPVELPNLHANAQDDQMLHFELVPHTAHSGIPEIDAVESENVERQITGGNAFVGLDELLREPSKTITLEFCQWMVEGDVRPRVLLQLAKGDEKVLSDPVAVLGRARADEVITNVVNMAYKGRVLIRAEVVDQAAVDRFHHELASLPVGRLRFGTPAFLQAGAKSLGRMEDVYVERVTSIPLPPVRQERAVRTRFEHDENEPLIANLHMVRFETASGPLPPIAMVMQSPFARGLEAELAMGDDVKVADDIQMLEMASALRHGMSHDAFADIVELQARQTDATIVPGMQTVARIVAHVGTFAANQINYTSDLCVPNVDWLQAQSEETQRLYAPHMFPAGKETKAGTPDTKRSITPLDTAAAVALHKKHRCLTDKLSGRVPAMYSRLKSVAASVSAGDRLAADWRNAERASLGKVEGAKSFTKKSIMSGEMWSFGLGSGQVNSGDCEDTGALSVEIPNCIRLIGMRNAEIHKRRFTRAFHTVLTWFDIHFIGAAVSEPYVKTDTAGAKPVAPPEPPIIGSDADKTQWEEAGHAYGMMRPMVVVLEHLRRGIELGGMVKQDARRMMGKIATTLREAKPWEHLLPSVTLEGTGMTSGTVGSVEESVAGISSADERSAQIRKGAAVQHIARFVKAKETPETATIAEFVRIEAQGTGVWNAEPPNRRRDRFYRAIGHVMSSRFYAEFGPTVAHMVPVRISTRKRGMNVGDYLYHGNTDVALVPIYANDISEHEWRTDHEPYMMAQLNQQPLFALFHHPPAAPAPLSQGHPLAVADLATLAAFPRGTGMAMRITRHLDRLGASVTAGLRSSESPDKSGADLQLVLESHRRADVALLPMSIPAWRLPAQGVEKTRKLVEALATLQARGVILGYALERSKPLPQCGDAIQVLVAIPVGNEVDLKEFPRPVGLRFPTAAAVPMANKATEMIASTGRGVVLTASDRSRHPGYANYMAKPNDGWRLADIELITSPSKAERLFSYVWQALPEELHECYYDAGSKSILRFRLERQGFVDIVTSPQAIKQYKKQHATLAQQVWDIMIPRERDYWVMHGQPRRPMTAAPLSCPTCNTVAAALDHACEHCGLAAYCSAGCVATAAQTHALYCIKPLALGERWDDENGQESPAYRAFVARWAGVVIPQFGNRPLPILDEELRDVGLDTNFTAAMRAVTEGRFTPAVVFYINLDEAEEKSAIRYDKEAGMSNTLLRQLWRHLPEDEKDRYAPQPTAKTHRPPSMEEESEAEDFFEEGQVIDVSEEEDDEVSEDLGGGGGARYVPSSISPEPERNAEEAEDEAERIRRDRDLDETPNEPEPSNAKRIRRNESTHRGAVMALLERIRRRKATPGEVKAYLRNYNPTTVKTLVHHVESLRKKLQRHPEFDGLPDAIALFSGVLRDLFHAELHAPLARLVSGGHVWVGMHSGYPIGASGKGPALNRMAETLVHVAGLMDSIPDGDVLWRTYWAQEGAEFVRLADSELIRPLAPRLPDDLSGLYVPRPDADDQYGAAHKYYDMPVWLVVVGDVFDRRTPTLRQHRDTRHFSLDMPFAYGDGHRVSSDMQPRLNKVNAAIGQYAEKTEGLEARARDALYRDTIVHNVRALLTAFIGLFPRAVAALYRDDITTEDEEGLPFVEHPFAETGLFLGGRRMWSDRLFLMDPRKERELPRLVLPDDAQETQPGDWV